MIFSNLSLWYSLDKQLGGTENSTVKREVKQDYVGYVGSALAKTERELAEIELAAVKQQVPRVEHLFTSLKQQQEESSKTEQRGTAADTNEQDKKQIDDFKDIVTRTNSLLDDQRHLLKDIVRPNRSDHMQSLLSGLTTSKGRYDKHFRFSNEFFRTNFF